MVDHVHQIWVSTGWGRISSASARDVLHFRYWIENLDLWGILICTSPSRLIPKRPSVSSSDRRKCYASYQCFTLGIFNPCMPLALCQMLSLTSTGSFLPFNL